MLRVLLSTTCLVAASSIAAQAPGEFGEDLEVHLVTMRVHVSTPTGDSIGGLTAEDFELREDGEAVAIQDVRSLSTATVDSASVEDGAESKVAVTGDDSDTRAGPQRVALVFQSSIEWPALTRALKRMTLFVRAPDYEGVEWSVVLITPETSLVVTPFTTDVEAIAEGLSTVRDLLKGRATSLWTTSSFSRAYDEDRPMTDSYDSREETPGEETDTGQGDTESVFAEQVEMRLSHRKRRATAHALENLIEGIGVDGSDVAVWLFHGTVRGPSPGAMSADVILSVGKVQRAWDLAAKAASAVGTPIYSINARGLDYPTVATSYKPHTAPSHGGLVDVMPQELAKTISAQTGGRNIALNHVIPAAELAFKEYGEAYEITYQVDRAPDGEEHKVEIEVPSHQFATLRYPRRYFDWSARERLVRALNTSAGIPKSGGSLPVEVGVKRSETADGRWTLTVGSRTPSAALGLVEDPETGEKGGRAEWFVAVYGEDGLLDELDSQTLTVDAADDDAIIGFELTVDPGEYTVAVAVLDTIDRKSGMAFTRVVDRR